MNHSMVRYSCAGFLLISVIFMSTGFANDLELIIQTDRQTYLALAPIWIDVFVVNHGDDFIAVPTPSISTGGLELRVFENDEPNYNRRGTFVELRELPTYNLAPGDTLFDVIDVSDAFPVSNEATHNEFIPLSGDIRVTASSAAGLRSDTIEFLIEQPTGIDAEASKLLVAAAKHFATDSASWYYAQILELYPESAYAPKACQMLIKDYRMRRPPEARDKIIFYSRMILSEYPESGDIMFALAMLGHYGLPEERQTALDWLAASESLRHRMIAKAVREGMIHY